MSLQGSIAEIRLGRLEDVSSISSLLCGVSRVFPEVLGLDWSRADIEGLCQQEGLLLAEDQKGILAVLGFTRSSQAWEVSFLATRVDGLRQGVMKVLLRRWLEIKSPTLEAWLETQESNVAALNLYLSQGFRVVGRRVNYYSNGEDAILLSYK